MEAASQPPLNTLQRVLLSLMGLVVLAAAVAYSQLAPGPQWLGLMLWYGGPATVALLLAFACGATRPTLVGITIGSAAYWGVFYLWVHSADHPDALDWLLYLFAAPGGWPVAMLFARLERRSDWRGGRWWVISALATLLALLTVQAGWMLAL